MQQAILLQRKPFKRCFIPSSPPSRAISPPSDNNDYSITFTVPTYSDLDLQYSLHYSMSVLPEGLATPIYVDVTLQSDPSSQILTSLDINLQGQENRTIHHNTSTAVIFSTNGFSINILSPRGLGYSTVLVYYKSSSRPVYVETQDVYFTTATTTQDSNNLYAYLMNISPRSWSIISSGDGMLA